MEANLQPRSSTVERMRTPKMFVVLLEAPYIVLARRTLILLYSTFVAIPNK
jgi:hypothetical protein